ncbi:MAG: tetratricopeptide repeat protein [Chitinophagales bacterium]
MRTNIIIAATAILAVVVLFFAFRSTPKTESTFDVLRTELIDSLQYPNSMALQEMHKDMVHAGGSSKTALLKQLSNEWLNLGQPAIASDYLRQLADNDPNYSNYMVAGSALSSVIGFDDDDKIRANLVYGARYCFEKALTFQPNDTDARIGLASVLVEGSNSPMEGITMLRGLDAEFPGNPKVNLELGRFSVMSGQFEKAIERFDTVLQKDSLNLQARFMMAQAYLGLQDTAAAIKAYENLIDVSDDPTVREQVGKEIQHLTH